MINYENEIRIEKATRQALEGEEESESARVGVGRSMDQIIFKIFTHLLTEGDVHVSRLNNGKRYLIQRARSRAHVSLILSRRD